MKRTTLNAILLLFLFFPLSVWAAETVKQETRQVNSFDQINVGSAFTVYLSQGTEQSVIVETEESYIDKIQTDVKNGVLHIGLKNLEQTNLNLKTLRVYVTIPVIKGIEASAATSIKMKTPVKNDGTVSFKLSGASNIDELTLDCRKLELQLSGASKMKLNLTGKDADIDVSGASNLTLSGKVGILNMNGSGASKIDTRNFTCDKGDVNTVGATRHRK
ncbi:MAG: DUF2807 domain-containing protein [Tannerella sp.]|jgi:hypothetical protein|nr:DUF2807 domain-containing protein [Tannerella sp.]